jgi:ankyrin repeat protein
MTLPLLPTNCLHATNNAKRASHLSLTYRPLITHCRPLSLTYRPLIAHLSLPVAHLSLPVAHLSLLLLIWLLTGETETAVVLNQFRNGALGQTAMHLACEAGAIELIELLFEYGADVDAVDACGETALHMASRGGHSASVQFLLESAAR